jgi:hypothetical protein
MKYISTFELFEDYNKPRGGGKKRWSVKYKKKINCNNPKGFSQIQYCKRKRRGGRYKTESVEFLSNFENNQELIKVLRDMSLDISDKDINVQIGRNTYGDILLTIWGRIFKYEDIKYSFLDIVNYMISEGFNIEIVGYQHFKHNRLKLELQDDILFIVTSDSDDDGGKIYDIEKLIIKFRQ